MTSTTFPNGETLTSTALTQQDATKILQTLTCQMLGIDPTADAQAYYKVRVDWPQNGQPG